MLSQIQKRFSSIRCVAPEVTLSHARAWAEMAGITCVTDITPLDRLGLPVFASTRTQVGTSTTTYGKGLLSIDAEVGAYMEAIEYHYAHPATDCVVTRWGTAVDVAGAEQKPDAILDFSPILQTKVDLNAPLLLAFAHEVSDEMGNEHSVVTGQAGRENGKLENSCLVPAELVYYPAPDVGQSVFNSSTNGLASGNSILEASIHALAEVIERDIWSFEFIQDSSFWVDPNTLPAIVGQILERSLQVGLKLIVRYVPNEYGLAFFSAFLFEPENLRAKFFNGGWGCHTNRDIALVRAVCEAAQSRLAYIHGSRSFVKAPHIPDRLDEEVEQIQRATLGVSNTTRSISYHEIPDRPVFETLEQQWQVFCNCLRRVTAMPIYRVIYTPVDAPLQVVRLIIPTLEDFRETNMRVGHRFKAALDRRTF